MPWNDQPTLSRVLAGVSLLALTSLPAVSAEPGPALRFAQALSAEPSGGNEEKKRGEQPQQRPGVAPQRPAPPAARQAPQAPQAQPPQPQQPQRPAVQERPLQPQRPATVEPTRPAAPQAAPPAQLRRPAEQTAPPAQPRPPAAAQERTMPERLRPELRREEQPRQATPPAGRPAAPTTQDQRIAPPPAPQTHAPPAALRPSTAPSVAPPAAQRPAMGETPSAPQRLAPGAAPSATQGSPTALPAPPPGIQSRPAPTTPPSAVQSRPASPVPPPGLSASPEQDRREERLGPATVPSSNARDVSDFIRRGDEGPRRRIDDIRRERQEFRQDDRTVIREPGRTIIRQGDRTIIRHNEIDRFAIRARDVRTERRDGRTITVVERPNGVRIITVTDEEGRLLRRVRRERDREIVIIDNEFDYRGPRRPSTYFVDIPPPIVRIPRERYILEAGTAHPDDIYEVLTAPPVMELERRYTLDQIRYTQPLRERMPRVDLDINFDSGSWQITPDQLDRLAVIADAINRAIERDPREVYLIEGHTDAVGSDIDNLSLSDRRAEAVAVALTEQFHVPAENLVTQGYGKQHLKVPTEGPERANRRVAVRRITPLLEQAGPVR